jgi:preprotein translocase subunit SecG
MTRKTEGTIPVDYLLGFLNVVIVILTIFLIGIILIQRGKGGGLAGAFGGMGGSSAFGTRTGDVFTKVTVGVAIGWILLSMLMVVLTNRLHRSAWTDSPAAVKDSDSASGKSRTKAKGTGSESRPSPSGTTGSMPEPIPELPLLPERPTNVPAPAPNR